MITSNLRKRVVTIKRLIKILLIITITYTSNTYALFTTDDILINTLHTINYNFQINASDGSFNNSKISINKDNVILPIPIKEGYSFIGYTSNNKIYRNETNLNEINNKILTAKWNLTSYSISYNLNGGNISNNKEFYNIEEEFTLTNPTKEGYIFNGWTGSNGDTPEKELTIRQGTSGDLEFNANWSKIDIEYRDE